MDSQKENPSESQTNQTKDWSDHKFRELKKELAAPEDLEKFKKSQSYTRIMEFISDLQQSVTSKKISDTPKNEKFNNIVKMLDDLDQWIDEIPPIQQPMRFGNKAYRTWHERLLNVH
jgi:serine/threonine-protein phosphatase 2A activator